MEAEPTAAIRGKSEHENTAARLEIPQGVDIEQGAESASHDGCKIVLLTFGPVMLTICSAVQLMIWLWRAFWYRAVDESQLQRYTSLVRPMFQADNDKPIYLGGTILTVILATIVYWLWRARIRKIQPAEECPGGTHCQSVLREENRMVRFRAQLHFWVAAAIVLLPISRIGSVGFSLGSAILGFAALALLYLLPLKWLQLWQPWPTLPPVWRWGIGLWVALALVVALLYIPQAELVSGFNYQLDRYTHWNAYAMFPALAYRNGGALITEHFVQYGVGWPLVLAAVSHFTPLSYALAIRMGIIWGCVYYGILFYFLQTLLRRTSWAFAGLALALFLQCFGGMVGSHKWALPSGTILRYSVDMLFFLVCLYHARNGWTWLGVPIGALAGCGLLFGIDTGLYLTVCLLLYLAAATRLQSRASGRWAAPGFVVGATIAFLSIVTGGLWVATRGTLFQAKFWSQWLEAVVEYGGGISDLPIADTLGNWCSYVILVLVLISYFVAILWMLQRLWFRKATAEDLITGLVALYGMATLLLFVGRSDPAYLRNVAIPFCVVLTRLLLIVHQFVTEHVVAIVVPQWQTAVRRALQVAPWLGTAALLSALFFNADFTDYPGLLQTYLGNRWTGQAAADNDYLFASRHDAPLPAKDREEVNNFRAVTAVIRELSAGGKTVAMLDMDDTEYLVEADIRPYFRYSPVLQTLLTKDQVRSVEQVLIDHPPDYVLYPAESPLTLFQVTADDVYLDIREVIRDHFILEKQVAKTEIYRRKAVP